MIIGKTSNALKSIGLDERNIVIDKSKIIAIKNKHPEMTDGIIKQIPNILENPTIILKSQSVNGRLVVFGDIVAADGKPVSHGAAQNGKSHPRKNELRSVKQR